MYNMQTQQYKHLYYYSPNVTTCLKYSVLINLFLTYFSVPSNEDLQSYWDIPIYCLLLSQIGMDLPAYDIPRRCHPVTTLMCDSSVESFVT